MSGQAKQRLRTIGTVLALPLRVYIGIVFIIASLYKISDPYAFALSIATYQILPLWSINPFALLLPWVELLVGTTMVLGLWTRESAALISGMMVMFLVALTLALTKDLQMSCGCFASQEAADEIGVHTIYRDLAWLTAGLWTLFFDDGRFGLDGWFSYRKRRKHAN